MTENAITFLMNILKGSDYLQSLVDGKCAAELPRSEVTLDGDHETVMGVTVDTSKQLSYFQSIVKGYIRVELAAQVQVLSVYKQNDSHCRLVVRTIKDLLQDAKYVGDYRIFVTEINDDVVLDSEIGRWVGTLKVNLLEFDPT